MDQETTAKSANSRHAPSKSIGDTDTATDGPADAARSPSQSESCRLRLPAKYTFCFSQNFCWRVQERLQPSASRQSARLRLRQVNIGVSRKVKQLALVSRNSWKRSRKSAGLSVSI